METQSTHSRNPGFTLLELMVCLAITTIIVTSLLTITSVSLDTWNRSRAELRASRQAKSMIDSLSRDLESMVLRNGSNNEWFSAVVEGREIGGNLPSTSASKLIFFTSATDRYDGQINIPSQDLGGDVSCVAYELQYKDLLTQGGIGKYETFVMSRSIVNPNEAFVDLLGKPDLTAAFGRYATSVSDPRNFICENMYQFSVTFNVEITDATGAQVTVPVTVGPDISGNTARSFRITGLGILTDSVQDATADQLKSGHVTSIRISVSVLSDAGIDQLRSRTVNNNQKSEFLAKYSYQFSKLVQIPRI
jgi:prepilin-type N-terminal cleavage/methylation domain-containing protein